MFRKISKIILLLVVFSFTFTLMACKDKGAVAHDTHIIGEDWIVSSEEH